jgi:2-polyprenyl-3-methyl-5-hydroxy-6-metoxy-1,4-benzoquinol methylase
MDPRLKRWGLGALGRLTRRTVVLLPPDAGEGQALLQVRAPYRVQDGLLPVVVSHPTPGELRVALDDTHAGSAGVRLQHQGPSTLLTVRLADGALLDGSQVVGSVSSGRAIASRRFGLRWRLHVDGVRERLTSHYQPASGALDAGYFGGDTYVDYEQQGSSEDIVALVKRNVAHGRVLDIGCATGVTMNALRQGGFDVCGVDVSEWAVERARARLGDVAFCADIEREPLPNEIRSRGPFDAVVLAAVLEHFENPRRALTAVTPVARPGTHLVITTTNAASLMRQVLGGDWEGYFDETHHSVSLITPGWLQRTLAELGWEIEEMRTHHLWQGSDDPTLATFREWFAFDARFRSFLHERDLGDFIQCVAVKRA